MQKNTDKGNKKSKNKLSKKQLKILLLAMALIGVSLIAYPIISRMYYTIDSKVQIDDFDKTQRLLREKDIKRRIREAQEYNSALTPAKIYDVFTEKEKNNGLRAYARMIELKEKIGHIEIPSINVDLPIYAGTSPQTLQMGIGHMEGTSLPIGGKNTNAVLTGHRGLPRAKLFTDLNLMKIGDEFYIHNIEGILAYKVEKIRVVKPTNLNSVRIVPGRDQVTLLTCTPYMINTDRLLVIGKRVPYNPKMLENEKRKGMIKRIVAILIKILIVIILVFVTKKLADKVTKKKHIKNKGA